jgi:glycerol-3-phosphate acyltransferase PlsX
LRIALDAMGGDYAPKNSIEGAVLALKEYPYIEKLFLVGDAVATENELKRLDFEDARIEIFHASEVVSMKESAAKAIRHKKDASICRAVDLVKNGSAHAVVSAGHTGAAVAASVLKLRTLNGIERPAVACLLPTKLPPPGSVADARTRKPNALLVALRVEVNGGTSPADARRSSVL